MIDPFGYLCLKCGDALQCGDSLVEGVWRRFSRFSVTRTSSEHEKANTLNELGQVCGWSRCLFGVNYRVIPAERQRSAAVMGLRTAFFRPKNTVLAVVSVVSDTHVLLDAQSLPSTIDEVDRSRSVGQRLRRFKR